MFVYGRSAFNTSDATPAKFPARLKLREASEAIGRLHGGSPPPNSLHPSENPAAIDAGVFHNDVVAVGNGNVLLYHELAYADSASAIRVPTTKVSNPVWPALIAIEV